MSLSLKHRFAALGVALFVAAAPAVAHAQQTKFPSAEAAAEAFVDAVARSDGDAVRAILGADYRKVMPLDEMTQDDKLDFLAAWAQGHRVVAQGDNKAVLEVGKTNWALPIPMVKGPGGWVFDTHAGADEMLTRRIGRNELAAMEAVLAYFDAQKEYARKERQPGMGLVYAQKFFSTPGKKDGLYWESAAGEEPSPLGPAYSAATSPRRRVSRLLLPHPHRPGQERQRRRLRLPHQGPHERRLRADRLAGAVRQDRHHEFHGQP